jgi:large subunit ribosomal protein L16
MLMPKKTKFRKVHRGNMGGWSKGAREVAFGEFGLVALEPAWVTARQIEAIRITISRKLKKVGEFFFRIFPDKPVSKKAAETRMGGGKGSPEFWVSVVRRGRVLVEVSGVDKATAKAILQQAAYKLPMAVRFVEKGAEAAIQYPD